MKQLTLLMQPLAVKHFICCQFLAIFIYGLPVCTKAQMPNHAWAKQFGFGSPFLSQPTSIISDAGGAVYVTGTFSDTNDFDPGPGVHNLVSAAGADIFILKLDAGGNFVWAKHLAGPVGDDVANSIAIDKAGNLFLTGYFYGTMDFDPGPGEHPLTTNAGSFADVFILKLDTDGNFIWVKQIGGDAPDGAFKIDLDEDDNILVCGNFAGTTDFDPGPLQFNLTGISLYADNFILKLTHDGDFVWVKQISGPSSAGGYYTLGTDENNNVIVAGSFSGGYCDFDPGEGINNLYSLGKNTGYVLKLDPNGNFKWVSAFSGNTGSAYLRSLSVSGTAIYSTGYFTDTVDFDPGPGSHLLTSLSENGVAIKLDSNGNFIWAHLLPYRADCSSAGLNGALYTAGTTVALRGITKSDTNGNAQWEFTWTGPSFCSFTALYTDPLTNIYGAGIFSSMNDFDPGSGTSILTPVETSDIFVHKLNEFSTTPLHFLSFTAVSQAGGNLLNWEVTNSLAANGRFQIQKSGDGINFITVGSFDLNDNTGSFSFLDKDIDPGSTAYYRVQYTGNDGTNILSGVVAIKNLPTANTGIKLWPVPPGEFINIKTAISYSNATIRLYDVTGKLVFSEKNYNGNFFKVALATLQKGSYTILISDGKNRQQAQIIK